MEMLYTLSLNENPYIKKRRKLLVNDDVKELVILYGKPHQ